MMERGGGDKAMVENLCRSLEVAMKVDSRVREMVLRESSSGEGKGS